MLDAQFACRILADEEAKESRLRKEQQNRESAIVMKAEAKRGEEERAEAEEERQAQHRALVVDVQSQRDRPALAKEEVARKHRTAARELRLEIEQAESQVTATPLPALARLSTSERRSFASCSFHQIVTVH